MSLSLDKSGRYTNLRYSGEIVASFDLDSPEVVVYERGCDEPFAVWRPDEGWSK